MATPAENAAAASAMAEAARLTQVRLRANLSQDITKTWQVLDFSQLQQSWPGWLQVMTQILTRYHAKSADDAALWYRATRQLELGDPGVAKVAPPPSEEWVSKALGYAAPGVYDKQTRQGVSPEKANQTALVRTLGTSTRIVLDGSRTTIAESVKADRVARGWYRVTDGDPCAFCALMASRVVPKNGKPGQLYKSKGSAGRDANERFTEGSGQFKFHDHCACSVAPLFTDTPTLGPIAREAADLYLNRGDGPALAAFRRVGRARRKG